MKRQEPLVSIGLTAYQRPKGLKRAIKSLVEQKYKNLEIIVSENYSPGFKIREVVHGFLKKDNRIKYFQHKPNKGARFNGRFVLEKASGKYFMWAADDDYWSPNFVSELVHLLENNPKAGLVMSGIKNFKGGRTDGIIRFNNQYNPTNKNNFYTFWNALSFPRSKYVYLICGLFKRELLQKVFPQITGVYAADRIFVIFFSLIAPITYVDKILYYRQIQMSNSSNEVNVFSWSNEIKSIIKLSQAVIFSENIIWYRKFYLIIAILKLSFRLLMLATIKIIGVLFKITLFIPKQLEKLQIFIAHRYY